MSAEPAGAAWLELSATGNRFAVLDLLRERAPADPAALARQWCGGAGGRRALDGLLLLAPPSAGGDCRMVLYNADGSRAEACGNGLRCVALLAAERGYGRGDEVRIETDRGPRLAAVQRAGDEVVAARVEMGRVRVLDPRRALVLRVGHAEYEATVTCVDAGNPHCVLLVEDERRAPVDLIGPALATHEAFARGANVGFLAHRDGGVHLRVWERGVGETRSCGSGACAAALTAHVLWGARFPVRVGMPGGTLRIDRVGAGAGAGDAEGVELALTGPVVRHGRPAGARGAGEEAR